MTIERLVEVEKDVESVKEQIIPEIGRRFDNVDKQFDKVEKQFVRVDDRFDKIDERLEYQAMSTERIVDLTYEIKRILENTQRTEATVQSHENRLDFLEKHHVAGKKEREIKDYVIKVVVAAGAVAMLTAIWKILGG